MDEDGKAGSEDWGFLSIGSIGPAAPENAVGEQGDSGEGDNQLEFVPPQYRPRAAGRDQEHPEGITHPQESSQPIAL